MLQCTTCKKCFEIPEVRREVHDELDEKPVETWVCCPYCGGSVEESQLCPCGSWGAKDGLCPDCKSKALKKFLIFLNLEFTPEERAYLNQVYDGISF